MLKNNINVYIAKKGYKKKFVAELLGITQQQLSNWIVGKSFPRLDKAFQLSRILDCTVEDLYTYEEGE